MKNKYFIHIGKTGGSSVNKMIKSIGGYQTVHLRKIYYSKKDKYLLAVRNPIQRFISAFNWRYHLLVKTGRKREFYPGEKYLLKKYQNVNNFVEAIRKKKLNVNAMNNILHINQDIFYYLGDSFKNISKKNVIGVIATETLDEDVNQLFTRVITRKKNFNPGYSKYLSIKNYNYLKKLLSRDYWCIQMLFKKKLIDQQKYDILSK